MAPPKGDGRVEDKEIQRRRSAPQVSSPTKHSPPQSSPLRKGLTDGQDMFSESEYETDAGGADDDDGGADGSNVGDARFVIGGDSSARRRQQPTPAASVAGPSTERLNFSGDALDQMSPLDKLVELTTQAFKKQSLSSRGLNAPFGPPSTPTPPPEELSEKELRDVENFISLATAAGAASRPPPVATFSRPSNRARQAATLLPKSQDGTTESTITANLPPAALFSPTGKILHHLREAPYSAAAPTLVHNVPEQSVASGESIPFPSTSNFSLTVPSSQTHHRQSQHPSQVTSFHPGEDFSCAIAAANAARLSAASFHPPIPHTPQKHEDTTKLDLLATVALGNIPYFPPDSPSRATVPAPVRINSAFASSLTTAQSPIDTTNDGENKNNNHNNKEPQDAASATMAPPPLASAGNQAPTRRRAPQRRAALKSQELSRKMTTKSEIRKLLKTNAENADAANNNAATEAGGSSPKTPAVDPATGKPYAEVDMGDHVFRDVPHKDSFFPRPKVRQLKKATAITGNPHDPESVKRHTERYEKRLESNTSELPDSDVRGAEEKNKEKSGEEEEDLIDRFIVTKMAEMARGFQEWRALSDEAARRNAELFVKYEKRQEIKKGKERAVTVESEDGVNVSDDENATITDSQLTTTDSDLTVSDDGARASAERSKLLNDAISVWQNNPEIRDHYHKLDREQTQRDLCKVSHQFNSRLFHAADRGNAPTPPPEAHTSNSGEPGSSSISSGFAALSISPTSFKQPISVRMAMKAGQNPLPPTPETSFTGERSAALHRFEFCMPYAVPHEKKPTANMGLGLDGTGDIPLHTEPEKTACFHDGSSRGATYEEVDFEIDNPVPPLPRGKVNADKNKKKVPGARRQDPNAPVNMTSQLGDDPFYYDPRFDLTEIYPGILDRRYRHKRHVMPGNAASRARAAADNKREQEKEQKRKEQEDAIRNDIRNNNPVEALLRSCFGADYIGPQGFASGSGSGAFKIVVPRDDPAEDKENGSGAPASGSSN